MDSMSNTGLASGSGASGSGKTVGVRPLVDEERLAAERSALILERQSEIERVLDNHDSYVREAFHLENFLTLVSFDPKAAKEDNSAVFQEYKAKYDLLDKASSATGQSRKTRSAHTERLQSLKGSSSASAGPSTKAGKRKAVISNTQPGNDVIWNIISGVKGKGKEKVKDSEGASKGKGKSYDVAPPDSISHIASPVGSPTQNGTGRRRRRSGIDPGSLSTNGRPSKRRKTEPITLPVSEHPAMPSDASAVDLAEQVTSPLPLDPSNSISEKSRRPKTRLTFQVHNDSVAAENVTAQPELVKKKSTIKRIRLVVRPPALPLSNPRQRPQPPKHGSSLPAFLASYTTVDGQDISAEALEKMATTDASLLNRIESFRKQGRLLPGTDIFLGATDKSLLFTDPKRNPDVWDHVLAAVVPQSRIVRRSNGKQIASQIASKIQGYWDSHAAKKDKVRLQEEKRLRALAKATIKMVTGQWKKAVFHIREQERLKIEAEEMRRGHEHLDAILDQSGQILETQQVDLNRGDASRSRSRSSSVSASLQNWGGDDEGEEDEEEEDNEEDNEELEEEGSSEEEEVDDTGASLLLGYDYTRTAGRRGDTESADRDDAPIVVLDDIEQDSTVEPTTPARVDDVLASSRDVTESSIGDLDQDSVIAADDAMDLTIQSRSSSPVELNLTSYGPGDSDPSSPPSPPLPFDVAGPDESFDARVLLVHSPKSSLAEFDGLSPRIGLLDEIHHEVIKHRLPEHTVVEDKEQQPSQPVALASGSEDTTDADLPVTSSVDENGDATKSARTDPAPLESVQQRVPDGDNATADGSGVEDTVLDDEQEDEQEEDDVIPDYLKPFAVAPVAWHSENKVKPPLLLRGVLRPYQQSGLEWLASLHVNNLNGILADEMGLGKTIQTISLLAHLACDRGIWGPHLIVVPTSVLLNWEMEFKKFLPGFKILSYHGTTKRRKELRQGWNDKHHFNVCITSYTLASRDAHIFKRKAWYYMILDEAHMIKNFKSQRWNILLMFRSFRRLLLTGTPLQNNLTELWALLQFLMSGANFANLKEFGEWFSNPLEKAIEMGTVLDDENMQRVSKLHTVLRPYLLRRLKRDVEKELPSKYEHLILCPLSKRQRFLYDEFMSRAQTRDALQSGVYQKVANILMQLRKVCNHPDLFEVRPIVTSFAMERSAVADFEIKELLIRRRMLADQEEHLNLDVLGLRFIDQQNAPLISALESRRLDATSRLPFICELPGEPPPKDSRTIAGFREYMAYQRRAESIAQWSHIGYLNRLRCSSRPIYSQEAITVTKRFYKPLLPLAGHNFRGQYLDTVPLVHAAVKSYATRAAEMTSLVDKFTFVTPAAVALDIPRIALSGWESHVVDTLQDIGFDAVLHRASVKLQIAFPDPSLLQYDCGKLQELTRLLREKKAGGHRVLIFTQMTKILDILEVFLNFHGYLYLRLDGATKIEDRQYITERFNADSRVFCFIASSRSGGVGINLTGADTVVFYDSDFNPQMDRQCEDRAHRIGQIRDVHIYRFISQHTVEEAMLRKANQKRSLDDLVIQKGEFDWRSLFGDEAALTTALGEFEDTEDAHAAAVAAREEVVMVGADEADFGGDADAEGNPVVDGNAQTELPARVDGDDVEPEGEGDVGQPEEEDEGGTTIDYMLGFVGRDYDFFRDWRL